MKHFRGKKQADIHTHSNKVYSPEQSSQESSQRVSDIRFTLFQNHTGEGVVTNLYKTSNYRQADLLYRNGK